MDQLSMFSPLLERQVVHGSILCLADMISPEPETMWITLVGNGRAAKTEPPPDGRMLDVDQLLAQQTLDAHVANLDNMRGSQQR